MALDQKNFSMSVGGKASKFIIKQSIKPEVDHLHPRQFAKRVLGMKGIPLPFDIVKWMQPIEYMLS